MRVSHRVASKMLLVAVTAAVCFSLGASADAGEWWKRGYTTRGVAGGTPKKQAPYQPGESPYKTGVDDRPKYFVPPTKPGTPTWKMYGVPQGLVPGNFPSYAPTGFGGYRFPAVGSAAYR
ncbi:MAG: hypothetical protein ACO3NZ_04670 [Pirellulales bacterium]